MTDDIPARIQVRQQILTCRVCGLRTACKRPVPFSGHNPNWIAVIGEAPGSREDETCTPFVGPSGQLLRKTLDGVMGDGFAEELSYLNVVCCYPHRTPTIKEVEACRPNYLSQMEVIRPTYALVVGGVAAKPLFPSARMGELRGLWSKMTHAWGNVWYFFTWHPAAVLRAGNGSTIGQQFHHDIQTFCDCIMTKQLTKEYQTHRPVIHPTIVNVSAQESFL
jgi:DNA polymerase